VHLSGTPFTDASGDRLRDWMGVSPQEFYDEARVAIVPMGFCFPGQDEKGADLPPRRECAPLWHRKLFTALPQIELVLAIGFYAAYTARPLVLYGTAWILILAFATRFLPIAYTNSDAALRSINPELEDAARILGAGRLLSLRRIVAPLLRRGLAGAFILVFIPATRELSSAIFLYTTGTQVLSVLLFDKSDEGNFEVLSSMGLILVVVTVALVLVGFRMVGRDFLLRRTAT
jgi:ABC-type spermidine/putrescine transport system permease subunit II